MASLSDKPACFTPSDGEPSHHRNSDDPRADCISLRPSWGRAVTRPGGASALHSPSSAPDSNPAAQQPQPPQQHSTFPQGEQVSRRVAPISRDRDFGASQPPADYWTQSSSLSQRVLDGGGGGARFASDTAAAKAATAGLGNRGSGGGLGPQLFDSTPFPRGGGGGGGVLTPRSAQAAVHPGSPLDSGRASPAHAGDGGGLGAFGAGGGGGGGLGASTDGGSVSSFLSGSPDCSALAQSNLGARSPYREAYAPAAAASGAPAGSFLQVAAAAPSNQLEPLLGPVAPGVPGALGAPASSGSAGGSVGLGPGQVYLVVDPATGLVVGTAQATGTAKPTGASTPGSLAPSTPGGTAFSAATGGGHTPTGSARSSLDLPARPAPSSGTTGSTRAFPPQQGQGRGRGPQGSADDTSASTAHVTRAALSLLGPSGSAVTMTAANAAAGTAAAVSQQNALALASLAAATDSASRAAATTGGGGAPAPQFSPSVADLLMLLASTGPGPAGGGAVGDASAVGGGLVPSGVLAAANDSMAVLANTLDAATAATLLEEGLAAGSLPDDWMMALAQVAGVLDAAAATGLGVPTPAARMGPSSTPAGSSTSTSLAGVGLPSTPLAALPFTAGGAPSATVGMPGLGPPVGFTSALLGPPASPGIFSTGAAVAGQPAGAGGLPAFASPAAGLANNNDANTAARASLVSGGAGSLTGLAGLGSPGGAGAGAGASWRAPSWRSVGPLAALGSPGPAAAVGPRTTQAAAAMAPQGLLAGLASPPGPRGTGPKHNTLYKTEMCRSWSETGSCRYGSKCQFAHGPEELRPVVRHPKYKTEHCRTFAATGACQYGNRCRFIHAAPPGSAAGTPRPQGLAGGAALSCLVASHAEGASTGSLMGLAEEVGVDLWERAAEPGGTKGLPAAAASLLSPGKVGLFSPTGRGAGRHSLSVSSPPYKMLRTAQAAVISRCSAAGDSPGEPLPLPSLPLPSLPLPSLPGGNSATVAGGEAAAGGGLSSSLMLLDSRAFCAVGNGVVPPRRTDDGRGSGAVEAAMQLFSAFGRSGAAIGAGAEQTMGLAENASSAGPPQQRQAGGDCGEGGMPAVRGQGRGGAEGAQLKVVVRAVEGMEQGA